MTTCEHPNDDRDRNRWRNLTESLWGRVSGANIGLHKEFERGLELLLCRQVPSGELRGVIHRILTNVRLAIESDRMADPDLLPALVRRTARQVIPISATRTELGVKTLPPNAVLESFLQQLPHNQREALTMVYVHGIDDHGVCALKGLTIKELTGIRASVRERFMASEQISAKPIPPGKVARRWASSKIS
jgi:hypothetical protein